MTPIHEAPWFRALCPRLAEVRLNPRRHTAASVLAHSALVAAHAGALASLNGCTDQEVLRLQTLGWVHDVGKVTGSARPERSVELLRDRGVTEPVLLALVRWHDTALPWHRARSRGEAPSDKAWRRLAAEVDLRLLALFMVSDRVDAPPGWRGNAPTTWFLGEARTRGLLPTLLLDLPGRPSEVHAGGVLVRGGPAPGGLQAGEPDGAARYPAVPIGWDELPEEAAARALRGAVGEGAALEAVRELPPEDRLDGTDAVTGARFLVRTRWFALRRPEATAGTPGTPAAPAR